MRGEQRLKLSRCRHLLVANQKKQTHILGLALQGVRPGVEQREPWQTASRHLRNQYVESDLLRCRLDTRGGVDRVAYRRIVEAVFRSHVADAGDTGVDADANGNGVAKSEGVPRIHLTQGLPHPEGATGRLQRMIRDVDWGVPERHDGIADELVERPLAADDRTAETAQQPVEETHEAGRVHPLANRSEIAYVHEQQGNFTILAAETQCLRLAFDAGQNARGNILAKGLSNEPLVPVGCEKPQSQHGKLGRKCRRYRKRCVKKHSVVAEQHP